MVNPAPNWQYPQAPSPYGVGSAAPPVLPGSMRRAVWLMWAGTGLSVVYSVMNGVMAQTTITPVSQGAFIGGVIIEALVQVALWLWMLWKVRAGRPWARVLSTVFFGFTCLQLLFVLASGPVAAKVLITVYFITALSALIMLYQRESSAFFSAAKLANSFSFSMQPGYGQPGFWQPPQQYGAPPQQYGQPPQDGGQQSSGSD